MKITFMLLVMSALQIQASTFAQTVSIAKQNTNLATIFKEIKKQTGYNIICNAEIISKAPAIDVKLTNSPLADALEAILQPLHLDYSISKTTIVVKREETLPTGRSHTRASEAHHQRQQVVSGRVTDQEGSPLAGVSVRNKAAVTLTGDDGWYTIAASEGDALVFSSIGFVQQEAPVGALQVLDIVLQAAEEDLDEVLVTALGIRRDEKSLGYAVQKVEGSSVQTAKEANFLSSLTGKVAGLNIQNPPGLYEDPRISLRGESSILVVVDNVPVETNFWNLSPDDIDEISVLKGPAAAALYGSRGQNGAILITTKRGGGQDGKIEIAANSSSMFQTGFVYIPETQSRYGSGDWGRYAWVDGAGAGTYDSDSYSWGPKLNQPDPSTASGFVEIPQWDSPIDPVTNQRIATPFVSRGEDNIRNFFETGYILSNNLSLGVSIGKIFFSMKFLLFVLLL